MITTIDRTHAAAVAQFEFREPRFLQSSRMAISQGESCRPPSTSEALGPSAPPGPPSPVSLTTDLSDDQSMAEMFQGFRFHPTDEELVSFYLMKKVLSYNAQDFVPIADVDVYKFDPWDLHEMALPGTKGYFFLPTERSKYPGNATRTSRSTPRGFWKATGKDKLISSSARGHVGMRKLLVYYRGRPPKAVRTNWMMQEYRLTEGDSPRLDAWVLCKIFEKSKSPQRWRNHMKTTSALQKPAIEDPRGILSEERMPVMMKMAHNAGEISILGLNHAAMQYQMTCTTSVDAIATSKVTKAGARTHADPRETDSMSCAIADFECSVGVVGTGFWRAPEILLAMKNSSIGLHVDVSINPHEEDKLNSKTWRNLFQGREVNNFDRNQCRILEKQPLNAEEILNKHTSPECDGTVSTGFSWPQSALLKLRHTLTVAKSLIEGCHNESCIKAYIRLGERAQALAETLKKIAASLSNVSNGFFKSRRCLPGNTSVSMNEFPLPEFGAYEELYNMLLQAATDDEKELLESLDFWIERHRCSARECGGPQHEAKDSPLCMATQILERRKEEKKRACTIAGIEFVFTEVDHTSVLWNTNRRNLEDVKLIGSGDPCSMFEISWLGGTYARKNFRMDNPAIFRNEAKILTSISHPNIVSMYAVPTQSTQLSSLFMERISNDLCQYLQTRLQEEQINPSFPIWESVEVLILQIAEAMKNMHSKRMIHRDLKAPNVLVKAVYDPEQLYERGFMIAKVADFGLSKIKVSPYSHSTPYIGTTRWMAPEVFKANADHKSPICGLPNCKIEAPNHSLFKTLDQGTRGWNVDEIRTMLELTEEALKVDRGPDIWDYVSENLWEHYGFDRASTSCENMWGILLQSYKETQASTEFELEYRNIIERILTRKLFDDGRNDAGFSLSAPASPLCPFQSSASGMVLSISRCRGEMLYDEATDEEMEEVDIHSQDEELSGDSTATFESQVEIAADSHFSHTNEPDYETNSNNAGRKMSADIIMEDELISRIAPFVNKQIEDTLKPLLSVLRKREEDDHKHRQKLLTINEEKLALKREKISFAHRVLANF